MKRAIVKIEDIRKRGRMSTCLKEPQRQLYKRRAWIARIGWGPKGITRDFQKPAKNYMNSNSCGSRGIWFFYFLVDGVYEISAPINWRKVDRYFCVVENGTIKRISFDTAINMVDNA